MPTIPLGTSAYERKDSFLPETILKNMIVETQDETVLRIKRPGLTKALRTAGPINGMYQADGVLDNFIFYHANDALYRINANKAQKIGDIPSDGNVRMVGTAFNLLGIVADEKFYLYNGTQIRELTLPEPAEIPIDIETINGYFIIACKSGRFYWLNPGVLGWYNQDGALQFATAELEADELVGVKKLGDEIWFFGTTSIESWSPTGNSDAILQRNPGRSYNRGCASRDTIQVFDNNLYWVGDDYVLYSTANVPARISNYGIEERLRTNTGQPSAMTFAYNGHLFYVLRIPGQGSFAYDASTQTWSEFQTFEFDYWHPHNAIKVGPLTYFGDSYAGNIFNLDPDNRTDDGTTIECVVSGSLLIPNTKPMRNSSISVTCGSLGENTIQVRWADQKGAWTQYQDMNLTDPLYTASVWRCGALRQPLRTFEFRFVEDSELTIFVATFNASYAR